MTTSFLDAIQLEDRESTLAARQAGVLAKQRADKMFGAFVKSAGVEGLKHVAEDIRGIAAVAAEEVGHDQPEQTFATVMDYFAANYDVSLYPTADSIFGLPDGKTYPVTARTAGIIHEARKPKMCPFHRDVVDISLADGNPRSGFEALRDHWGGPRHCQGEGYEGDKCKFKPQMTTQAFWDDKAEKAEQRRKERAEQEPVEELDQNVDETSDTEVETPEADAVSEPVENSDTTDTVVEVDFTPQDTAEAPQDAPEVPMSMAASTKTADGTASPVMDKRKWTPQSVPFLDVDDDDGRWPTRHKDVTVPIKPENADKFEEIGEATTERVDVTKDGGPAKTDQGGTWTEGPKTAISATIPNDVDKNPITALMQGEYDGFLPQHEVQQAITASRR